MATARVIFFRTLFKEKIIKNTEERKKILPGLCNRQTPGSFVSISPNREASVLFVAFPLVARPGVQQATGRPHLIHIQLTLIKAITVRSSFAKIERGNILLLQNFVGLLHIRAQPLLRQPCVRLPPAHRVCCTTYHFCPYFFSLSCRQVSIPFPATNLRKAPTDRDNNP